MTDRIRLDDLTSDQLDALYDELTDAREQLRLVDGMRQQNLDSAATAIQRAEQADAAIARVRNLHQPMQRGPFTICSHCSGSDGRRSLGVVTNYPCPTLTALDEPGQAAAQATEPGVDRQTAQVLAALHRSAEQNVSRVIALYERWVKAGPPRVGTSMSRWWEARLVELRAALDEPGPASGGCSAPGPRTEPNNHSPA